MRRRAGLSRIVPCSQLLITQAVTDDPLALLGQVLLFIFSAPALGAIAVIISGNFLSKRLNLPVASNQLFKIPVLGILTVQATGGEVILGFASFIVTLLCVGGLAGPPAYVLFRTNFGTDPGQFNSLCILSSFGTVSWTFLLFLLGEVARIQPDPVAKEHERLINKITSGG